MLLVRSNDILSVGGCVDRAGCCPCSLRATRLPITQAHAAEPEIEFNQIFSTLTLHAIDNCLMRTLILS